MVTAVNGGIPAGPTEFPIGRRLHLTQNSAQFTSSDGDNHLISLGEFAAAYLMAWSPACWGEVVSTASIHATPDAAPSGFLRWLDTLSEPQDWSYPTPATPSGSSEHLFRPVAAEAKEDADKEAKCKQDPAKWAAELARRAKSHRNSHRVRTSCWSLWRVRRLLANVPTYMIMDDHDLTDDFFLNPMWRRRVRARPDHPDQRHARLRALPGLERPRPLRPDLRRPPRAGRPAARRPAAIRN